jgi:hypothetical protein
MSRLKGNRPTTARQLYITKVTARTDYSAPAWYTPLGKGDAYMDAEAVGACTMSRVETYYKLLQDCLRGSR